jgi:hypothetical protein
MRNGRTEEFRPGQECRVMNGDDQTAGFRRRADGPLRARTKA